MKNSTFKTGIVNFLFAGIITSNAIVNIFTRIGGVSNGIVLIVGGCVALILLLTRFKSLARLKGKQILFAFFLLVVLMLSLMVAPSYGQELVIRQFFFFILMGLGTLFVTNIEYDIEIVFRSIVLISFLLAPILLTGNFSEKEGVFEIDEHEEWMGFGYSIVTLIIADLFYLFVYRSKLWMVLSMVSLVLYIPSFFWHSSRGAFGAILGFVFLFIIQRSLLKGRKISRSMYVAFFAFLALLLLFLVFDVETLIVDSGVHSLAKFFGEGDVSNGRSELYAIALSGFWSSPIWGNGVGSFANYTIYPHNLFLQSLYEGGIFLFGLLTWILFKSVRYILNARIDINKSRLLLLVFSCSFFELLFSATFWEKPRFWLTMWITLWIYSSLKREGGKSVAHTELKLES